MQINGTNMRHMRPRIEAALEALGKELGVKFSLGNAKFSVDQTNGHFKLEVATVTDDGTAMTKERADFQRHCRSFGLLPTDLDREVTIGRQHLRVIGIKPNSRVRPIMMAETDGKKRVYVYPAETIARILRTNDSQLAFDKAKTNKP